MPQLHLAVKFNLASKHCTTYKYKWTRIETAYADNKCETTPRKKFRQRRAEGSGRKYMESGLLTDSTTDVDAGRGTSPIRRQRKGTHYSGRDGPIHTLTYLNAGGLNEITYLGSNSTRKQLMMCQRITHRGLQRASTYLQKF